MPNATLLGLFSHLPTSMLDDSEYVCVPPHSDRILKPSNALETGTIKAAVQDELILLCGT